MDTLEPLLDAAIDHLRHLVAFPTVSADSNLALIEYVRALLAKHGIDCELFPDATGQKANLWATLGGDARVPGLVLSGHTDVVPVKGQPWTRDPFVLGDEGDKLYGRGTTDMKGFIACVLALIPQFAQRRLSRPVHLALSHDEEVGCIGIRSMLAAVAQREPKPFGAIIGEPTRGRPVLSHKGKIALRCDVTGHACHSAHTPDGVNAIEHAARMIVRLRTLADDFRVRGRSDPRFDPPFTTVQTGVVHGGVSVNVVPDQCSFVFEARAVDPTDLDRVANDIRDYAAADLLPQMRAIAPESDIRFESVIDYPALDTAADAEIARWMHTLTGHPAGTVSFGSEGGLYAAAGIPAVLCGPGDMAQGHKPDEFITRTELRSFVEFLLRLTTRLESPQPALA
ncbi:MAG: acetylornithine deacetylase [Burkholderiales bacterium]|nr:acetylornithine deacetylase [Burkholderiales bacterium]